jgi:hypothetical protein
MLTWLVRCRKIFAAAEAHAVMVAECRGCDAADEDQKLLLQRIYAACCCCSSSKPPLQMTHAAPSLLNCRALLLLMLLLCWFDAQVCCEALLLLKHSQLQLLSIDCIGVDGAGMLLRFCRMLLLPLTLNLKLLRGARWELKPEMLLPLLVRRQGGCRWTLKPELLLLPNADAAVADAKHWNWSWCTMATVAESLLCDAAAGYRSLMKLLEIGCW